MAAELGRHPGSLIRWRRLRRSPPYLRVNGRVLYRVADVMRWLDAQVVDQQAPRK